MFITALEKIGVGNYIDLSDAGLDDLKVMITIVGAFISFIGIFVLPWIYGWMKIGLLFFK